MLESEWAALAFEIGVSGWSPLTSPGEGGMKLALHLLGQIGRYVTDEQGKGFTHAVLVQILEDSPLLATVSPSVKPDGPDSPFPYGFPVVIPPP